MGIDMMNIKGKCRAKADTNRENVGVKGKGKGHRSG